MTQTRSTTCNRDCPDACRIVATIDDEGQVTRLQGGKDHPVTQGFLCYRTSHFHRLQYGPQRVTTPLMRDRKSESLQPVSWDAALDRIADRLQTIKTESGPAAIFHYRSGGSLGMSKHLVDYFFSEFGPVTVKSGDICSGAGEWAQEQDFGLADANDLHDLINARHILLWGKNVTTSSPHTIPVLKAARAQGTRITLIDPVRHRTAALCDDVIQVVPGGDLAFALAVGRIVFERDWGDTSLDYVDGAAGYRALCDERSVEAWCELAGATPVQALGVAEAFRDGPCTTLIGWGMARRRNGASIVRAIDALALVTGNIGKPGAGASYYFQRKAAFDLSVAPLAEPPRTIPEPLFGPAVLETHDPPIRAMWITAGNPVCMLPDSTAVARAIESTEFVIVVDSQFTDTARRADVVLPAATFLEDKDVVGAYGHHYLGAVTPVVHRPAQVRSDYEIVQALAGRVGLGERFSDSIETWLARFCRPVASAQGKDNDDQVLRDQAIRSHASPKVAFADRKFPTVSGRAQLLSELPFGVRAAFETTASVDEYPLQLLSVSTPASQSAQWAIDTPGPLEVRVHPDSAAGCPDGELARLESSMGQVRVRVVHDPDQLVGVALFPKGGHFDAGNAANALIPGELTDFGDGAALYDHRVRLSVIANSE